MHFTSSSYCLASQVKLSTAKKIYPEMGGWFLEAYLVMTNFHAKATNSIAKWTNSIAKVRNSFANGTNSIAKAMNSIAKICNCILVIQKKRPLLLNNWSMKIFGTLLGDCSTHDIVFKTSDGAVIPAGSPVFHVLCSVVL